MHAPKHLHHDKASKSLVAQQTPLLSRLQRHRRHWHADCSVSGRVSRTIRHNPQEECRQ
jgi:hypothetical protein